MPKKKNTVTYVTNKPKNTARYKEVDPSSFKTRKGGVQKSDKPKMMKTKFKGKDGFNIPTAKMGSDDVMDVPTYKRTRAKNDISKIKYTVGYGSKATAQKNVKAPKAKVKTGISKLPKATMAGKTVDRMSRGSRNLASKKPSERAFTPTFSVDKKTNRPAKVKKKSINKAKTIQVKQSAPKTNRMKMPSDAPAIPVWESVRSKVNVVESVVMTIDGKPKMEFSIATDNILGRLSEQYQACGYQVDFYQAEDVHWKNDEDLMDYVFECVNSHYNGLYESSAEMYNAARYRLAELCSYLNNELCESKSHEFENMITSAINEVHKAVEDVYLNSLEMFEGVVRLNDGENIVDVDIQTYALNPNMALRLFRNEIIENYGFKTEIMHVFIDGDKYDGKKVMGM